MSRATRRRAMGVLVAVVLAACGRRALAQSGRVSGDEARRLVAGGALLLDVRTREEFAAGHVAGALNIPVQELAARTGELPVMRAVVVYCAAGSRSAAAAVVLRRAGFAPVYDLGPMAAWASR